MGDRRIQPRLTIDSLLKSALHYQGRIIPCNGAKAQGKIGQVVPNPILKTTFISLSEKLLPVTRCLLPTPTNKWGVQTGFRNVPKSSIPQSKIQNWLTLGVLLLGMGASQVTAQVTVLAETTPPQPLEDSTKVPLIPKINRPLTASERNRILDAIAQLQTQAQEAVAAGDDNQSFTLWYKELELQRALGLLPEIEALARIGAIAWEKSRTLDVNILIARLEAIQKQVQELTPVQPDLLNALATAYQQFRDSGKAIVIYQQILQLAINQEDQVTQDKTLQILGQLYVDRFDYTNAATIYEQLLKKAESQEDYFNQGLYLRQLAEIYSQALQPENAVLAKQKLAESYLNNRQLQQIPALKIAIADDYQAIENPESASQNYQEAFSLAWSLKQLSIAGEALTKLANLYSVNDQKDYALKVYQELIKVEQQAYDFYGLMTVYDRMGQIYVEQKNYGEALKVFQNALQLARSLSYQEAYFIGQIDNTKKQMNSAP